MKMIWIFSLFTRVLEIYFGLYKVEIDIVNFYSDNKCINSINSMFKTFNRCVLERFIDTALTPIDS